MTMTEAIAAADALRPGNPYSEAQKRTWLSALDGRIWLEVQQNSPEELPAYPVPGEGETDTRALLVPAPFEELYPAYLVSKIDFADMEWEAYGVSVRNYNTLFDGYAKWYLRQHRPAGAPVIY